MPSATNPPALGLKALAVSFSALPSLPLVLLPPEGTRKMGGQGNGRNIKVYSQFAHLN